MKITDLIIFLSNPQKLRIVTNTDDASSGTETETETETGTETGREWRVYLFSFREYNTLR